MNKKYITTKECRTITGIETPDLVKLCKYGKVDYYVISNTTNKYRINIDSLKEYLKYINVPAGAFRNIKIGTYTLISGYDHKYAVNTETGEVVNFDNGGILTPRPNKKDENGIVYYQVFPIKGGKRQSKLIHRMVLEAGILPNNRNCDNVHHIDGNPANNCPANLLPTFSGTEHKTLDKLRNDKTKKKEYQRMVKKIKKLNKEEWVKIPHPDYQSDGYADYFMFLSKKGYQAYKQGKEIPLDSIRCETVERIERK